LFSSRGICSEDARKTFECKFFTLIFARGSRVVLQLHNTTLNFNDFCLRSSFLHFVIIFCFHSSALLSLAIHFDCSREARALQILQPRRLSEQHVRRDDKCDKILENVAVRFDAIVVVVNDPRRTRRYQALLLLLLVSALVAVLLCRGLRQNCTPTMTRTIRRSGRMEKGIAIN
jgi:hypothetical protein